MKFHTEYLTFHTLQRREYINITAQVQKALGESGIREGIALVSAMHITAAVYVNDAEEGLIQDIDEWLERLAPYRRDYRHHRTGEDNGDAHLRPNPSLCEVRTVPVHAPRRQARSAGETAACLATEGVKAPESRAGAAGWGATAGVGTATVASPPGGVTAGVAA